MRSSTPPIKKLSPAEMKVRREKGLFYNCNEKYSLGHRCKVQRLYLLDGAQIEGKFTDQEAKQLSEEAKVSQEFQEEASPEISLHAISGTLATQTMRLKGIINRPPVVVQIDSESTHNFIDLATARKTGVKIHKE